MRNKITESMNERLIVDRIQKDTYFIVGTEIRARRFRLSMTLEALADGICSLSYLCKIENSKIEPNREFLRELCERLELTDDHVDTLLNLRGALEQCVKDFLFGRSETIDKFYKKGKGFDNYRYTIIEMIYFIYHKNISSANKKYLELVQIVATMREFDFIIFSLFSAYLQYLNFRFNEAIEILENLNKFNLDDYMIALRSLCLLKASFGANKVDTSFHFANCKNLLIEMGLYDLIDEIKYILCLHYLKNDNNYFLIKEIDSIRSIKYKNSLKLIKDFKEKNVSNVLNYDNDSLTKFASLLKLYVTDYENYKKEVENSLNEYYVYDFDFNYLDILAKRESDHYVSYLFNCVIPRVCSGDDNFIKHYVLSEVAKNPITSKNKNILRAYYLLFGCDDPTLEFGMDGDEV